MLRRLAGQTMIYGGGTMVARLLNYLLTPYLTRIMTPEKYGVVTDMYALIPFALVVLTMGLETGFFRFASKAESDPERRNVFSTTWGAVCAASVLFLGLVLLFNAPIANALEYASHPSYIWMVAGIICLDAIAAIPFVKLRRENRPVRFVSVKILSVAVNILFCVFFYAFLPKIEALSRFWDPEFGAGYVFAANLIASAVTLLALLPSCKGIWPRIEPALLKKLLLYSAPLLLSGIAGTANEFIDRQMIKYLMPASEAMGALGIYGAVVKIGVVLVLFTQMYRFAAEPFFLSGFSKENFVQANAQALKFFIIVSIGLFLGIALFADLFALIVGTDFRQGVNILPVVLLGNVLAGVLFNLSFWYKQNDATRFALYITLSGLAVTVLLNIVLVPRLGYFGAAIARTCCEAAMVVLSFWLNQKYCRTPYDLKRIGFYALAGVLIYAASFLSAELPPVGKYSVNLLLVALFGVIALRKENIDLKTLFARK